MPPPATVLRTHPLAVLLLLALQAPDATSEGMKALEARNYTGAVDWFTKAVTADPKDYAAQFHLGLAYSLLGKNDEAIPRYKTVLELKPGLYEGELNLGILLLKKNAKEAIGYLESAAQKKPREFRPAFYLGEAQLGAGDPVKAEQSYRLALEIDAKSAAAHLGLGQSLARQAKLGDAGPEYRKAAEIDGEYRSALLELASFYEAAKQPGEAIAIYQEFADHAGARERAGALLIEAGRVADAVPHLEFAVARSATSANRLALATAYLRTSQPERAQPLVEQALAAEPGNIELRLMLGRLLRDRKNYAAAAQEFYRVAQAKPDSREAWNELAGMLILLENYAQALVALDRLKALGEETPAHHFFRAIVLDRLKQPRPALESYEKFLALSGGKHPDEEFKARQRVKVLQKELNRR